MTDLQPEPKRSMSTLPDEPECTFLLEEKSGFLAFSAWTVRNLTVKGQLLCYNNDGILSTLVDLSGSNTIKLPASSEKARQFRFQLTSQKGSRHIFNAAHEEAREKCIIVFNFASKTAKWFYPFDELSYIDHPTMEIFGLPIKKPIYVPKPSGGVSSSSSSGPIIYTTGADKKKAMTAIKSSGGSLSRPDSPVGGPRADTPTLVTTSPIRQHKHHVPFSAPSGDASAEESASPSKTTTDSDANFKTIEDASGEVAQNANSPFPPSRAAPKLRSPKKEAQEPSPDKMPSPIIDATPAEEVQ